MLLEPELLVSCSCKLCCLLRLFWRIFIEKCVVLLNHYFSLKDLKGTRVNKKPHTFFAKHIYLHWLHHSSAF